MATPGGSRSRAPINTLLSASPAQLARMTPEERTQMLKRMKGRMPSNGQSPADGGALAANTILT